MTEHIRRRPAHHDPVPGPVPIDEHHRIGDEALHFTRWFVKSKYHLMGGFIGELTRAPGDPDILRERFARVLQHAHRVHRARAITTLLLAMGIIAAAASAVADVLAVRAPTGILVRAAALSASGSVLLIALRMAMDRYLDRCDIAATFLAIELRAGSWQAQDAREETRS